MPLREHVRGRARRRLAIEQVDDARHGVANFSGGRLEAARQEQRRRRGVEPVPLVGRRLGQTAAPVDVLKAAIVDLQGETEALDRGFRDGVAAVRERQMQI